MKRRADVEGLLCILDTGDMKECKDAINILGELRDRKAINPLIGLLGTDDIQIRSNAAWALGEIGDARAMLPLIGLLNDPVENVRINAAWALGRIGDRRAISGLKTAIKSGSSELRKHAKEAIIKIESEKKVMDSGDGSCFSHDMDIPLVMLDVHSDLLKCDYVCRGKNGGTGLFSEDIMIKDTRNQFPGESPRKIVLGLKNEFHGLVSVDVIFRYADMNGDNRETSSVWLQMSSLDKNGSPFDRIDSLPDLNREREEQLAEIRQRDRSRRKPEVRHNRPVEYEIPYEREEEDIEARSFDDEIPCRNKKITKNKEKRRYEPPVREEADEPEPEPRVNIPDSEETIDDIDDTLGYSHAKAIIQEPPMSKSRANIPEDEDIIEKVETVRAPPKQESHAVQKPEIKTKPEKPAPEPIKEHIKENIKPEKKVEQPAKNPTVASPPASAGKVAPPPVQVNTAPPAQEVDVNSAVTLLSNIGMSGMTNAASTVTQLSGQEADSLESQLRTIPIDQIHDEIISLGESVVMIEVGLFGRGEAGEVNGGMQLYLSKENALDIANELLCNPPNAHCKEFNEDIISTLKETTNIFGGQYVSAISEYIGVPLFLKAPSFKNGPSSQLMESIIKGITGNVEFALATDLSFGNNKSGRLIMLFDPKSFETIIQKLF